jgi:AmmeMemoRadiSam system protein B
MIAPSVGEYKRTELAPLVGVAYARDVMKGTKPRLRDDLVPVRAQVDGRDVILLRDPMALSSQVIALGGGAVGLLAMLDGTRGVPELRLLAIRMQGGRLEAAEELETLLEILDERCLLDNQHFREAKQVVLDDWHAQTDRPSVFAGSAYPDDPSELSRFLGEILDGAPALPFALPPGRLVAMVVPHVDLGKGWPLYGAAYALLSSRGGEPTRILLMGTGHAMDMGLFSPTTKHYVTPLGRASTDVDCARALVDAGAEADIAHRGEHSLEFQVIFLQHVYAENLPPIVPVLCGDAAAYIEGTERPSALPGVGAMLARMAGILDEGGIAVAGVDLSHVGPKFGHAEQASVLLEEALGHETTLIGAMERCAVEEFWAEARRVGDRFHVCGLSSLGFLLEILPPGSRGVLLGRDVMREPETSSAVGFAAMAFFA